MASRFFKKLDLELALGGASVLVQLADKDGDGIADSALVEQVIDTACADMASRIDRVNATSGLSAPFPPALRLMSARMGAYYAWGMASDGQAIPQPVQSMYETAQKWAGDVADRKVTLGGSPRESLDPPATYVDPDPYGMAVSIKGFKRGGFR